jgi:hypothetical protein
MRLAAALPITLLATAVLASTAAHAGGIGIVATGGAYQDRVYYYDQADNDAQYQQSQLIGMGGTGIELMLGDRDDRIVGLARTFWSFETPQHDPSENPADGVNAGAIQSAWREETRHVGVFAVGLQAGLIGNPDEAMLTAHGLLGSGFLTTDHTEYVYGELGAGGTVRITRTLEAYANLSAHLRFRKWARGGAAGAAGVRVLFD